MAAAVPPSAAATNGLCVVAQSCRLRPSPRRRTCRWSRTPQGPARRGCRAVRAHRVTLHLLRVESVAREVPVGDSGGQLAADDRLHRRHPTVNLAATMMGRAIDRLRRHLGLEDRRHRLRMVGQLRRAPVELRGVYRRQLDHRDPDLTVVMYELGAYRVGEAAHPELRPTVGRLQGDRAVRQRRANLYYGAAIARHHPLQRRHRSVNGTEVGDLGGPREFHRTDLREPREHRRHSIVHPDVDVAEARLHRRRGVST